MRSFLAKIVRFICYSNPLSKFASNKIAGYYFPALMGFYYLTLDVWGDDWHIITKYKDVHLNIYLVLVSISVALIFLRGTRAFYSDLTKTAKADVGKGLIMLTSRIVKAKLDRFHACAANLDPTGNTFRQITRPDDQISVIISEILTFLYNTFDIEESETCITIMHCDVGTQKWHYMFNNQTQWNHTKAGKLIAIKSMAAMCVQHGEPIFHPDKVEASKKGEYFMSPKDERSIKGSAYCHPVVVNVSGTEYKFVISVITYGKILCNSHNEQQVEATKLTLRDICRRIELELTLWSMRHFQFDLRLPPPVQQGGIR